MRVTPRTLDELKAVKDPTARALAAKAYLEQGEEKLSQARRVRDLAIQEVLKDRDLTAAQVAAACGVSVSTVKALKRWVR